MVRQAHVPGSVSSFVIEGKLVTVTFDKIPLSQLKLDPENPRIQHALETRQRARQPSQDDLRDLILKFSGVEDLFKSVRDNGGLIEPIFVREDGRVVEGNCRTAVFLRLKETFPTKAEWAAIPAWRMPSETTERQFAVLQAMHHVNGKLAWRPQEQAGHLHRMRETLNMDIKDISRATGIQERVVERLLATFETMKAEVLPKFSGNQGLEKFSYIEEFYKNSKLKEFRAKPANVKAFAKLVVDGKLARGENVRDLPRIIENEKAFTLLKTKGHAEAMRALGKHDPTANSTTFRKLKHITETLERLPASELDRLRNEPKAKKLLRQLFSALKNVANAADVELA